MSDLMTSAVIDGLNINFSVPITKVDKERRIVHGFATLDNLDKQSDVVPLEASIRAFQKFAGNIREMHERKAVGRMVNFKPETYYDPKTNKVYKGIFVSAYVSKGAPDTWEKVLDGTLRGFSIGGNISKASPEFDEDLGKSYRVVEDYSLTELSLVDNPANNLAVIVGIEKSDEGYLLKTYPENVFWCKSHNVVRVSDSSSITCYQCDQPMQNIGFVETNDADKMSVVKGLLENAKNRPEESDFVEFDEGFGQVESIISSGSVMLKSSQEAIDATETDPVAVIKIFIKNDDTIIPASRRIVKNISSLTKSKEKEVENMENENVIVIEDEIVEKAEVAEAPAEEQVVEEVVEKAEVLEGEIAVLEGFDFEKGFSEIKDMIAGLTAALAPIGDVMKSLGVQVQEASETVVKLSAELEEAKAEVETVKSENSEFGKRVEDVEKSTAFRKSADLGEIAQPKAQKAESLWGGRFLDNTARSFN